MTNAHDWTPRQVANARAYLESQGVGVPADRDTIHTPCRRCGDERYFRYWAHVAGGMCFECGGAGGRDVHVVVYARRLKARRRRAAAEEERRRRAAAAEERAAADREMRAAAEEERRLERQREWCEAHGHGRITFAELDAQRAAQSEHVGALGERREFAATVEFVTGWDGPWGYTRLYGFRDDGGNALVYRSGHALRYAGDSELVERGHRVRFTATVKEHSVRKGERQTRVARPAKVSRGWSGRGRHPTAPVDFVAPGACDLRLGVDNGCRRSRRPPEQPAPRQRPGLSKERDMTTNICPRTSTRRAACLCSVCSMDKDPGSKGAANKRDVTALLGMIAAAVEDLDGPANWAKASTIANLRQQLRDIAVGLALRDGESEEEAAARIEAALERGDAL